MSVFYENPRLMLLSTFLIVLVGALAYGGLARQEDPTMTERYGTVSTFLPGATASRMESLVSEPIETRLREIPEVRTLRSNSRTGYSLINVELHDHVGADQTDVVWSELRDKLAEVHPLLPAGTSVPLLEVRGPIATTLVVALTWEGPGEAQLGMLTRLAESLRIRLANLPNTRESKLYGAADEQVLVAAPPHALADAGLTAADLSAAIAAADTKRPAGRLQQPGADLLVEIDAELDSAERIARIPLRQDQAGGMLRVGDVATVRKLPADPPRALALVGEQQAVLVGTTMEPDSNIDVWMSAALAEVNAERSTLPGGIAMTVAYNQNDYTAERLQSLGVNLIWALVIVMATLVWFMGVRSALTVGVALPLSGAMVLGGLYLMDIPLHQMSVTGLIISLGLLIDNAIVITEDYRQRRHAGLPPSEAIRAAVGHLAVPLGASTATTVLAFLTIALAPGGTGDFTGTIGVSVVLAVISSYLLAMTMVPAMAAFAERWWPADGGERWWQQGFSSQRLTHNYRRSLDHLLRRPGRALAVGCLLPVVGFALAPTLTQQFFPPVDRNQFQIQISMPAQSSIWQTREAVRTAEALLRAQPEVTGTHWSIGESPPRTYYNVLGRNDGVASFAGGWVNTTSAEATRALLPRLQPALAQALPEAQVLAMPFEQGPPFDAPIEIRVEGRDPDTLRQISDRLRQILSGMDTVIYTRAGVSATEPKLAFIPNENQARAVGLTSGALASRYNDALFGVTAGTVMEGNTTLPVRVRLDADRRSETDQLAALPLLGSLGTMVPAETVGRWELVPAASGIERYQGARISTVQAHLSPFVLPAGVMAEFRQRLDDAGLVLPDGYRLDIGGEAEERAESVGGLMRVFAVLAAAMAAVVVLSLNSFRQAGLIALVAVLSFGLALFGVRLFGYPMGFTALIGALGMVGLAINGAIIVLSALKADPKARAGDSAAAVDVVVDATRHILSTTVTTIGGFVPLILFGGTFWPPLATAIAGGVAGSAIIALYTVPALYLRMNRRRPTAAVTLPVVLERLPRQPEKLAS